LPRIVPIDDPDDPRIAVYRQVRERDLVGRGGGFIAEGEVVLRVLLGPTSRFTAASLLVAEKRLERLAPLIAPLAEAVPVYAAGQAVIDAIVGFHIHRGILAHGLRGPEPDAEALLAGLPPRAVVLVLFGIANHDNLGGLLRNAAAFGADAVLLDAASCDPLYRKAIRVSVGAALSVPFARLAADQDPLDLLARTGFDAIALSPAGAEPLAGLARPDRVAVLLGAEGPGLAPGLLAKARTAAIPMAPGWDSLNVAAASAVALHELTCRRV
jgi:tRNA G18 (ribose-2'-O)-methylase SpoU